MSKDRFRRMKEQLSPSEKAINELYEKIEHEKKKPRKHGKFIKYGSIAACFVFVLAGTVIAVNMSGNNSQSPVSVSNPQSDFPSETSAPVNNTNDTSQTDEQNTAVQEIETYTSESNTNISEGKQNNGKDINLSEDDTEIYEDGGNPYLNAEFEFNGNQYIIAGGISNEAVGKAFNRTAAINNEIAGIVLDIQAAVYYPKDISPDAAIIIEGEHSDYYYICINKSYAPQTLGDFVKDFNINESISFENIQYQKYDSMVASCTNYSVNASDKELYNMLFANLSASSTGEYYRIYESPLSVISIYMNTDTVSICASLDESGYLTIKTGSVSNRFYIGTDNAQEIFDYVQTQYTDNNTDNSVVQDSDVSDSETSYTEIYNSEPVWDEYLGEYIIPE